MFIEEIDPSCVFNDPPDLTARIASTHLREINILLHSLALLSGELEAGGPPLPVLRAAMALVPADRALLYRWDDLTTTLRPVIGLGFAGLLWEAATGGAGAMACLLQRKPVLAWSPSQESLRREPDSLGARGSLSVPIVRQGLGRGVIQLLRDLAFEKEEALLLWLFALALEGVLPQVLQGGRRDRQDTAKRAPTRVSRSPHVS